MYCLDDSPRFRMIELDGVDSTNSYLKGYRPLNATPVTLVTAEHQTAGRGQAANAWESAAGKNLLFSLLLRPKQLAASALFAISEAAALSIREAIQRVLSEEGEGAKSPVKWGKVAVKWPNDVYVGDGKIAGILIENELRGADIGRCIVGCGVNVNQERFEFPERAVNKSLSTPTPVSLHQLTGHATERRFVLEDIMEAFMRRYEAILRGRAEAVHAEYKAALYRGSGAHIFRDSIGIFEASIADVEPTGHLLLRDAEGRLRRYAFKEVAFA